MPQTQPTNHPQATDFPALTAVLAHHCPQIEFALLIGSRAKNNGMGTAQTTSDWDIALWPTPTLSPWAKHCAVVDAQYTIASALNTDPDNIDTIDLHTAGLTMCQEVADHGILLKQDPGTYYNRFLVRTWREVELMEWERAHPLESWPEPNTATI